MALQSTKQMYSYLLLLACVNLALSQAPGERQDTVRKTLHAIHSNPCQKEEGNKTRYYACSSEPLHLLRPQNANFNFSTTPLSATCGVAPTTYCTLGIRLCGICDQQSVTNRHPAEYMIDQSAVMATGASTWWQSVSWTAYPQPLLINITISFDKSYVLQNDLIVKFHSSRPRHMILEKSADFGRTWSALQYYSKHCREYYKTGVPAVVPASEPDAVVCSQSYSSEMPFQNADVRFAVMDDRYRLYLGESLTDYGRLYEAFNSTALNSFLTFTDIRLRLLHPATDGKEVLRQTADLQRYFYAISDIEIIGGCSCNLHGKYCEVISGRTVCKCEHHTAGASCDVCQPLYRNRLWKPGFYLPYPDGMANECQKCECHSHADSCTYVAAHSEGTCDACQHHTVGRHCDRCADGFFPNASLPLDSPQICAACDCEPLGVSTNSSVCNSETGQCVCKELLRGRRCDMCIHNYYGLTFANLTAVCKRCDCDLRGTKARSNLCDAVTGQCPCRETFAQRDCSRCEDGFYRLPDAFEHSDCLPCHCDPGGSTAGSCDKRTGRCACLPHIVGLHCTVPEDGYYVPAPDAQLFKPTSGSCQRQTALHSPEYPFTGRHFVQCNAGKNVEFDPFGANVMQPNVSWWHTPAIRYNLNGSEVWDSLTLEVYVKGGSSVPNTCPMTPGHTYTFNLRNLTPGVGSAWLSDSELPVDTRCLYGVILTTGAAGAAAQPIMIDSFLLLPSLNNSRLARFSDATEMEAYSRCTQEITQLSTRQAAIQRSDCLLYTFVLGSQMARGALACVCNGTGREPGTGCQPLTGQCVCKPGVQGRACDQCAPGYSRFSTIGCTACDCSREGATSPVCSYATGQCDCRGNVPPAAPGALLPSDRQCRACLPDHYGLHTGAGCRPCECHPVGSEGTQCDDSGQCPCKDTVDGRKCDECAPAHFNLTAGGCIACNCSEAGSAHLDCNAVSGRCVCKENTVGEKCGACRPSTFSLSPLNPAGCRPCFCSGHATQCRSAAGFAARIIHADSVDDWELAAGGKNLAAPQSFLGNHMNSYGQSLDIYVHSRFQDNIPFEGQSTVILFGNGQLIYYDPGNFTIEGKDKLLSIVLHESFWLYSANQHPSSAEFFSLLADLSGIYIQRVFGHEIVEMRNISMLSTKEAGIGDEQVSFVENCTCDATKNVHGLSCEQCAIGYWRDGKTGPCVACACNNRAATSPPLCDPDTGDCLNCRVGYAGTRCERCAPNVSGATCSNCVRFHWGLNKDGCKPCVCNKIGSIHQQCNRRTGNCVCGRFILGASCDECRENYASMTPTRCQRCLICYMMIETDVKTLRKMASDLTTSMATLRSQQNLTKEYRPFVDRLNFTNHAVDNLNDFLETNKQVNSSVGEWISRLADDHRVLQLRASTLSNLTEDIVNGTLMIASDTILQAQQTVNSTQSLMQQNVVSQADVASRHSQRLQSLVDALSDAEHSLQYMSENSDGNVLHAAKLAQQIEALSATAQSLALPMLEDTQKAVANLTRLQQAVVDLVQSVSRVDTAADWLSERAQWSRDNVSLAEERADMALRNATESMQGSSGDLTQLHDFAGALQRRAATIQAQAANALRIARQTTVNQIAVAVRRTAELTDQVTRLKSQSDSLYQRVLPAHQEAAQADTLEKDTFTKARGMLDIMRDFRTKAAGVEEQANVALRTVERVRVLSERATVSAEALRASLRSTHSQAQAARTLAGDAFNSTKQLQQVSEAAITGAEQLKTQSDSALDVISGRVAAIDALNATQIQPAVATCSALQRPVAALRAAVGQVTAGSATGTREVGETRARIEGLLRGIAQTGSEVTADQVAALRRLVTGARVDFDRRQLTTAVQRLREAAAAQEDWVEAATARKEAIRAQIGRLRLLQQQLRPTAA